jgi:ribosomal protein L5
MKQAKAAEKSKGDNPMREIKIEKLIINCCVGEAGDRLTKASKVLEDLTGQKPVQSKARYTIRSFGIKRGEKMACHVTVRGEKAAEILDKALRVKEYELKRRNFSNTGKQLFGLSKLYQRVLEGQVTLGSESLSTLTWESDMIHTPVSSEWTSTVSSPGPETE